MAKKRNGEIDLFRFIFSVIIVILHFNNNYGLGICSQGAIGVEFFFVVSGYLMASHVEKMNRTAKLTSGEVANSTWKYIINKISSFYAYYISVVVLYTVIRLMIVKGISIINIIRIVLDGIPTYTLTFMGLNYSNIVLYVGNTWFLSVMIIAMFILYPMLLKSYDFSVKIIFPLLSLFILGYMYTTNNTINMWQEWTGICYIGVIRAIAEISLGACLRPLSVFIVDKFSWLINSNRLYIKLVLTAIKYGCYCVVLGFACNIIRGSMFTLPALLFCSIGVLLSFSNVGYGIPDCKFVRYLGKLSLPIFIYHGFIRVVCKDLIPASQVTIPIFIALVVMSIILSVMFMYITDFIMKYLKRLANRIKQSA